jgi:hypothetical protein
VFIAFACCIKVKKAIKPPKYNITGPVMVMPTGGGNYQAVPVAYQPVYAQPQYTVPVQTPPVNAVPTQNVQSNVVAPASPNTTMNKPAKAVPAPPPFNPTPAAAPILYAQPVAPIQYAQPVAPMQYAQPVAPMQPPVVPMQQTPAATDVLSNEPTVVLGDNTNDN